MSKNSRTAMIILIIILNLVLWPFFIVPNAVRTAGILLQNSRNAGKQIAIVRAENSKEMLERIDFYRLRDPFAAVEKPLQQGKAPLAKEEKKAPPLEKPVITNSAAEEKYESRFKLKSIVLLRDKYAAALEEIPRYGNPAENTPYSYRFGDNYDQSVSGPKSYLVIEGDTVSGEKIVKITADSVILEKNDKYYKLTFSGGAPVEGFL